jgi:hypothetical protein
VLVAVVAAPAFSATNRVRLPSAADTIRARIRAEQLLRGGRGPERTLPGEVRDEEVVNVEVTADGSPVSVVVDQRLHLADVGDFFVKVPGPVLDVEALPDSDSRPGLRSRSLVWQGFANDGDVLGARVTLDPEHETGRLPISVELHDNGEDLSIDVENLTGRVVSLPSGIGDTQQVAKVYDLLRSQLLRGKRPEPGKGGLPRSITLTSVAKARDVMVPAPLRVVVRNGKRIEGALTLSGTFSDRVLRVSGVQPEDLVIEVRPVAPSPWNLAKPGNNWTSAASGRAGLRRMLDRIVYVLAETARLPDVDGYLGNPDRDGPTETRYLYSIVDELTAEIIGPPLEPSDSGPSPLAIVLAALLAVGALGGLTYWWASS